MVLSLYFFLYLPMCGLVASALALRDTCVATSRRAARIFTRFITRTFQCSRVAYACAAYFHLVLVCFEGCCINDMPAFRNFIRSLPWCGGF